MKHAKDTEYFKSLIYELINLPKETEWIEFKENQWNPVEIGEYISALSNSATIQGENFAYLIWGINDLIHEIVGTTFLPSKAKKGNEELENWLKYSLTPRIDFQIIEFTIDEKQISMLRIPYARHQPVSFNGIEYIRIGSIKKKLKEHPEKERSLWRLFDTTPFERQVASERHSSDEILSFLDYQNYYKLLQQQIPISRDEILQQLIKDKMIANAKAGKWDLLNLGAIVLSKSLNDFDHLSRKSIRVIQYHDDSRIKTKQERIWEQGYANVFENLVDYINDILPENEIIGRAFRRTTAMFPEIAIRELVANAIIHQDFSITGTGPIIEIFSNRMEITNPGLPLIETIRFLDSPPQSRNEALAAFFRRINICEERGSGIDKVVFETEFYQLPAPLFETTDQHTKVVLFSHIPYAEMDRSTRIRSCYLHACLQFVSHKKMTNTSLRERFNIKEQNRAQISRLISDTISEDLIRLYDTESSSRRNACYIPFWA